MNGHLRRALALLMSLAVALGVIPVTPALAVNDVYTGQALVGEYGYHAKVRVEVDENGDILSVSDNGTEPGALNQEYWNRALEGDVFAAYTGLESYLIENYEDTIDAVTGATASSKAVFQAVVSAMNGEAEEPDTLFDIDEDGVLKEYAGDAERVEIPSGVVELDEYSFSAKENVQTVVLPASVQYINTSAFQNCPVLTNFEVDAGNEWFYGEDGVIYGKGTDKLILFPCGRTGSYSVKDGVTALGDGAFFSTGLTSLRIPTSVNSIGDGLIDLSENISEILVDDGNADYASADGMLCSKAMDTLLLVPSALSGEHTIPDSIRELGEGVFYGCTKLTKITLPDGLEEVPTLAFAGCSALREVVFPESVTSIGDRAFAGCNALRSFTVPKNVTRLGTYLFSNAANLAEIQTEPENSAYVSVDGVLFTADRKTLVQYPTGRAGDYTVPEGTVQLAAGSFYSAELIEAVTIPDSVTAFGSGDGTPLGSIVFGMYDYPANLRIIASESSAAAQYAESMSIDYAAPSASVEEEGTDYQAEPGRTIAKDTMVIAPPRQKDGGHTWDSIWFGTWQGEPLKYRVLDPEQANSGDPDGLFLLSENLLGTGDWGGIWYHNAEGDARSNAWQGSDARNWCQDFAGLSEADEVPDSLTAPELAAVLETDKDDGEYGTYPLYAASEGILQGDRVFFPSGEELSRGRFGFSSAVDRAASYDGSDKDVYYWTRSPILHEYGITYSAGVVKRNGGLDTGVVDDMNTARPALNLSKSRIAFISAAENGKASGTGAEALTAVTDYNGGEWKLTLRADRRDVSVSDAVTSGGDVTFRYHGAAVGENEYLSAIVTDTSGGIQYYGRLLSLSGADSGAGTASVRLPDGFDPEEQTLYVFSEQYNGDKRTDLAGTLAAVPIEETPAAQRKDGVYTGTGQGFGGEITVEVTITNGKIASVTSPSHAGESYWTARNVDELLTRIAAANSTDVDGVTGATLSSNGVKEAVRNALAKAVDNGGAFASGSGTAADPYVIETADQLTAFAAYVDGGETCAGQYVVLGADVDLTGRDWNPIGAEGDYTADQSALFNGVFDGQGHTIQGLAYRCDVDGQANVGLFSALNTEAVVRNVRLENVSIAVTGTADGQRVRAGGIAGATVSNPRARTAVIDSCSVTGSVGVSTANAMGYAAGVVGQLNGGSAVLNCCANVTVSGSGTGMAGRPYVGGLTANNGNGSVIANCAVRGSLSSQGAEADGYIGGIAGMLTGTVENVWSAADVTFGGTAESNAGLLAGMMLTESASAYYASDAALSIGGSAVEARPYGGEDEAAAVTKAETASASFADTLNGSLYDTFKALDKEELPLRQWVYETGAVLPTGELWVNETPDSGAFESGTGTQDDPYVIVTEDQLRAFAGDLSDTLDYDGLFVTLGADIALTQGDWTPIGGSAYVFEGTFDGQGHTIRGMTLGSESEPAALDGDMVYFGLFGVLGSHARVKNVHLTEAGVYGTAAANTRLGGIAGMLYASDDSMENYAGGVIDGCSVSGTLSLRQANGNAWVGGITAYQNRGAIVNCWTDVEISCVTASTDADRKYFAEAGGLVGLNNRGLTANCYALGNVTAGADQSGGDQSEAVAGGLIGCNAGALSGSYFHGNLTALGTSSYTGVVSGWITGIGKAYHCFYNADREMTIDGTARTIVPVGTLVPGGKSDEGLVYTGGVIEKLEPYTTDSYAALANALNESFAAYPVDITGYGLASDALCQWISQDGTVTFTETAANAVYVQPDAEIITPERPVPQDGIWYGRDEEKTTVVKITVENGEVTNTEVLSGEHSGEGYEKALELAAVKASIGDATTYDPADTSRFGGGNGTEAQPYLISNEEQLRYLASSVNRDVDWAGVWFRQTADIALHGEFLPIGWAREYFDSAEQEWQTFAYPFSGSYDGGGYTISGLTIGSESQPSDYLAAGLFGMTAGEYATNEEPSDDLNVVQIRNVAVRDAAVHVSGHQTYVGGLIGIGQDGILVDDCSVTGTVHSCTTDSFSRVGGMAGNLLRGRAADCWTNTDTYAHTTQGSSYSGGLCAMSNRIAMLNCYTLGTTRAYADSNERAYAAGISAFAGELKYNVYAYGAVIAESVSNAVGGVNGLVGGITKEEKVYFNTDAEQSSGGVRKTKNSSHGLNYVDMPEDTGYSSEQLQSAAFAAELNENLTALPAFLESVRESLGYPIYYSGDSLRQWALLSGNVVGFAQTEPDAEPAYTVTVNNGTGGGPRKQGENVTITADTPPSGQSFKSWTWTGPDGFTLPNPGSASTTFTMPDGNVTVTATWQSRTTQGCYVATAVYGSYDCPEVWTLRRFRDQVLAKTWYGRLFIHLYYAVSPTAVRLFGGMPWFQSFWRSRLDDMTARLQENGFASTPYEDQTW